MHRSKRGLVTLAVGGAMLLGTAVPGNPRPAEAADSGTPARVAANQKAAKRQPARTGEPRDVETRIRTLHRELRITPEQEDAWNDVANAMRRHAQRMQNLRSRHHANAPSASAPEVIDSYAETVDAHAEGVRRIADVFQNLYEQLSDRQRRTADEVLRRRVEEAARKHAS